MSAMPPPGWEVRPVTIEVAIVAECQHITESTGCPHYWLPCEELTRLRCSACHGAYCSSHLSAHRGVCTGGGT